MTDPYLAANRELWDAWTDIHVRSAFYDVEGFKRGGVRITPLEQAEVGDVRGKRLLHLQCHFGLDTLSWARLGARVTGADFSARAIAAARQLADETGLDAEFVESSVADLPDALTSEYDVVYTSHGVLGWLPELRSWGRVIERFLAPGGFVYAMDAHPLLLMLDDEAADRALVLRYPYFGHAEPLRFETRGSYADPEAPLEAVEYGWSHSIADILGALLSAGLRIEHFAEHPVVAWQALPGMEQGDDGWWRLPSNLPQAPLSFSVRARKLR